MNYAEYKLNKCGGFRVLIKPKTFFKKQNLSKYTKNNFIVPIASILLTLSLTNGCTTVSQNESSVKPETKEISTKESITPVDVAIASVGFLKPETEYSGTTKPAQEVSLRSQVEGRLLSLNVDAGDRVSRGQTLARIDDQLQAEVVSEAQARLTSLQSELAQAQTLVRDAKINLEETKVQLQQAQNDAERYNNLAEIGAISRQQAETYETAAKVAEKNVQSATEQIRTQEKAAEAISGQIAAQKAVISREQQRQGYAELTSPITGVVLVKISEPGNLVNPGEEILKLGNFSQVKVVVPVSDLDVSNLRVGQSVTVRLDGKGDRVFDGKISRISPSANPDSRQVPVEVTIPNPNNQTGSGLLARVKFQSDRKSTVVLPDSAIIGEGDSASVFVVAGEGEAKEAKVEKRGVKLGNSANGKVEVISGIKPGERFVVKSGQSLENGETVRLSIISEK